MFAESSIETAAHNAIFNIIGSDAAGAQLVQRPLSGGSEAAEVKHVTARYRDRRGKDRTVSFVIKHLQGRAERELAVYRGLVAGHADAMAPRLLDVQKTHDGTFLVLEAINRASAWPWRHMAPTTRLLGRLGAFHASTAQTAAPLPDWDYESELAASAAETRNLIDHARRDTDFAELTRHCRLLDRIVLDLPKLRRALLGESVFGARAIHGDVHPGNAMVRQGAVWSPVLIDWARARPGSPLEDVSSILQSLRFYEPRAMLRHDQLLKDYLTGIGKDRRINDSLRSAYWVAGACNALAGALNQHLQTATDTRQSAEQRQSAFLAARDWMRIIRRAHAWSF